MHVPTGLRRAVAVVCAIALASSPVLVSQTTAGASGPTTSARAAMPHLTAKATKRGINVKGTNGLRAGRVHLTVKGPATVEFVLLDPGYSPEKFVSDVNKCPPDKCNVKALRRAIENSTIIGGTSGGTGTIVFPRAGSYTPFSVGERGVVVGRSFEVGGPPRESKAPKVDGSIIAKKGLSWGGASTLPADGRFEFKNRGNAGVPHFVQLQQVVAGTTADQVLAALTAGEDGPPPPFLEATLITGTLSPGRSMTVDYDLPPGHYAVMCFFPDPDMKGMPHAYMGMIKIIHLT